MTGRGREDEVGRDGTDDVVGVDTGAPAVTGRGREDEVGRDGTDDVVDVDTGVVAGTGLRVGAVALAEP